MNIDSLALKYHEILKRSNELKEWMSIDSIRNDLRQLCFMERHSEYYSRNYKSALMAHAERLRYVVLNFASHRICAHGKSFYLVDVTSCRVSKDVGQIINNVYQCWRDEVRMRVIRSRGRFN